MATMGRLCAAAGLAEIATREAALPGEDGERDLFEGRQEINRSLKSSGSPKNAAHGR